MPNPQIGNAKVRIAKLRVGCLVLAAATLTFGGGVAAAPPDDGFAAAYLAGHIAERRGDSDVAADRLAAAMALAPETPALRRRVVRLQVTEGAIADAARGAEALAIEGDDNFPIGLTRIVGRFQTGDFAGAAMLAESPETIGVSPVIARLAKAWALAGAGDVDGGAKVLTDAAKESENVKIVFTLHAGLLAEQAERPEVAQWMFDEAIAAAKAEGRPPSGRLIQAIAGFYDRRGKTEEAAQVRATAEGAAMSIEETAALGPIVTGPAGGMAEALFNFAASLYSQRQYNRALIYARLADALRPSDPSTLFVIGQILEARGRSAAAAEVYRATPPLGEYAWRAPMRVAEALSDAGDIDGAIKEMQAVLTTAPDQSGPAIALGHMLRGAKRYEEAVAAYDEAVKRKGGELGPDDAWLRYSRGVALERSGDWPAAEAEFLKALEALGEEPLLLNYLGYTWVDRGEHLERARGMVARAVELRPDDGFIRDSLGWAEYRMGDFPAAAATLEKAVALQPLDPIINEHLGDAYWRVGRIREARFQWRRALSFKPEEKQIAIIEDKLKCGVDGCGEADAAPAKKDGDGG